MRQHMDSVGKTAEFYSYGMAKGSGDGMPINRSKARGEEKTLRMMLGRRRKQKQVRENFEAIGAKRMIRIEWHKD